MVFTRTSVTKMNTFVVTAFLVCLFAAAVKSHLELKEFGELGKIAMKLHDTCSEQTGADLSLLEEMKKGIFPDNLPLKKYVACLWVEATAVDKDFNANYDLIEELIPPKIKETGLRLIKTCFEVGKSAKTLEDKLYEAEKCMYEKDPENFVIF